MAHVQHPPNGYLAQWILDQFPAGMRGYAIDVGASDGRSISTTFSLEKYHGWTVLCVEPNPELYALLIKERAFTEQCACDDKPGRATFHINVETPEAYSALRVSRSAEGAHGHLWQARGEALGRSLDTDGTQGQMWQRPRGVAVAGWQNVEVRVATVDELLQKWEFPQLDALCIDVEGTERNVLMGCDLAKWKPHVVIVEAWTQGVLDDYLLPRGYGRAARSVDNDLYKLVR